MFTHQPAQRCVGHVHLWWRVLDLHPLLDFTDGQLEVRRHGGADRHDDPFPDCGFEAADGSFDIVVPRWNTDDLIGS